MTIRLADSRTLSDTIRQNYQLSVDGDWLPDFPNAASFLPPFFGCHGSHNIGYYCNRRLDRLMQRATQADADDDAAGAAQLWAEADRLITDQAYWVPTISLNEVDLVSSRLHNYVYSPVWGFLADQAWVR